MGLNIQIPRAKRFLVLDLEWSPGVCLSQVPQVTQCPLLLQHALSNINVSADFAWRLVKMQVPLQHREDDWTEHIPASSWNSEESNKICSKLKGVLFSSLQRIFIVSRNYENKGHSLISADWPISFHKWSPGPVFISTVFDLMINSDKDNQTSCFRA